MYVLKMRNGTSLSLGSTNRLIAKSHRVLLRYKLICLRANLLALLT